MDSPPFKPATYPGTLHHFTPTLVAFEFTPPSPTPSQTPRNILILLPGLTEGLLAPPYTPSLLASLPANWTLIQPLLPSANTGWGITSLTADVAELSLLLSHLSTLHPPPTKTVLIGHSTGCQLSLHYLASPLAPLSPARPPVHGVILQAPVSDRQALAMGFPPAKLERTIALAREYVSDGRAGDVLPSEVTGGALGRAPVSAERWLSLTSPEKDGEDDYFSDDLGVERLLGSFGKVGEQGVPLCVLYSGEDEYVPASVDKEGLVRRWGQVVKGKGGKWDEVNGGVVEGASHNLSGGGEGVVTAVMRRVGGFLKRVEGGDFSRG